MKPADENPNSLRRQSAIERVTRDGTVVFAIVPPPLLLGTAYLLALGQRLDYLGHFLAACGASLAVVVACFVLLPDRRFAVWSAPTSVVGVALCVAAGAFTEATVFRLAKWDEIDFCAQSLGAVVAGASALNAWPREKPSDRAMRFALLWSMLLLLAGGRYAFQ